MRVEEQNLDAMRKRAIWRAEHRGMRELDLVMGGFAQARLAQMDHPDLLLFERLLDVPDQQMLDWLTGQETVPTPFQSQLMSEIMNFTLKHNPET
jgi:antitoxin CptB